MRLARAGALVRIVCQDDACEVCKSRSRMIYAPADVPRLPVRGCMNGVCRCRFVAVDPETELTVPQLVERGITALRAGRNEISHQAFRRAVALDEMYAPGWLWLGAVVDDLEKVQCLQKVLAINPRNHTARAGLAALQKKLAQTRPLVGMQNRAAAQQVAGPTAQDVALETEQEAPSAVETPPSEIAELRIERRVIVDQWDDFIQFAVQIDPQMLVMQGQAFLNQLERLREQALRQIPESEQMARSLVAVIEAHREQHDGTRAWQAMHDALRLLAQNLADRGRSLRARILAARGHIERG